MSEKKFNLPLPSFVQYDGNSLPGLAYGEHYPGLDNKQNTIDRQLYEAEVNHYLRATYPEFDAAFDLLPQISSEFADYIQNHFFSVYAMLQHPEIAESYQVAFIAENDAFTQRLIVGVLNDLDFAHFLAKRLSKLMVLYHPLYNAFPGEFFATGAFATTIQVKVDDTVVDQSEFVTPKEDRQEGVIENHRLDLAWELKKHLEDVPVKTLVEWMLLGGQEAFEKLQARLGQH